MKTRKVELERLEEAVTIVRREFPHFTIQIDRDHPHVAALAKLPAQSGLDFDVGFNLQNCDELHLNVSNLWVEWFPCRKPEVADRFNDALVGVLSGRYRVLETHALGSFVSARLQRPDGHGKWKTIHRCVNMGALVPWLRSKTIVQNMGKTG